MLTGSQVLLVDPSDDLHDAASLRAVSLTLMPGTSSHSLAKAPCHAFRYPKEKQELRPAMQTCCVHSFFIIISSFLDHHSTDSLFLILFIYADSFCLTILDRILYSLFQKQILSLSILCKLVYNIRYFKISIFIKCYKKLDFITYNIYCI